MKQFLFFALLLTSTCLLTCNNDDDDISADDLIGTWDLVDFNVSGTTETSSSGVTDVTTFEVQGTNFDLEVSFTANPNDYTSSGTFDTETTTTANGATVMTEENGDIGFDQGSWSVAGDVLTLTDDNGEESSAIIEELSSTTLRIRQDTDTELDFLGLIVKTTSEGVLVFSRQ